MPARVTLIHGLGCDNTFWGPQMAHLASLRWLVWAPNLPYHGGVAEEVAPSLNGLSGWVASGLQGRSSVLIGHSLGGMVALQIAHLAPELVSGIVLVDAFPNLKLNAKHLPELHLQGAHPAVREWVDARRAEIIARMSQPIYDEIWPSVCKFNAVPWLSSLRCPVLGIYGGRNRYHGGEGDVLRQQLRLDRVKGPLDMLILRGGDHFVNLEYPTEVGVAIADWIKRHFGPPII